MMKGNLDLLLCFLMDLRNTTPQFENTLIDNVIINGDDVMESAVDANVQFSPQEISSVLESIQYQLERRNVVTGYGNTGGYNFPKISENIHLYKRFDLLKFAEKNPSKSYFILLFLVSDILLGSTPKQRTDLFELELSKSINKNVVLKNET